MNRIAAIFVLIGAVYPAAAAEVDNDYPTAARADYVFGCMASTGQTQQMLGKCSCSIDVIASIMPYERYVQSETILRMRQIGGEKSTVFRDAPWMKAVIDDLKRAQAEAELACF
ncbi:MAG: hypothetical protein IIB63_10140 [Proteobacteria bacterium]|nr:hypothetical protein [Pseudomonadota bacterium]